MYSFGADLSDVGVRDLAVVHRPHVGDQAAARRQHPVQLAQRVLRVGQVAEQVPAEDAVYRGVQEAGRERVHLDEDHPVGDAGLLGHAAGDRHRVRRGVAGQQDGRAAGQWRQVSSVPTGKIEQYLRRVLPEQCRGLLGVRHRRIAPQVGVPIQPARLVRAVPQRNGRSVAGQGIRAHSKASKCSINDAGDWVAKLHVPQSRRCKGREHVRNSRKDVGRPGRHTSPVASETQCSPGWGVAEGYSE